MSGRVASAHVASVCAGGDLRGDAVDPHGASGLG